MRQLGIETLSYVHLHPTAAPADGLSLSIKTLQAESLAAEWGLSIPIEALVDDAAKHRSRPHVKTHITNSATLRRSMVCLMDGVYLSSPESVFVQLSRELDVIELTWLADELASSFALGEQGVIPSLPLTSIAALEDYAKSVEGYGDKKKIAAALRYARDGAESPREIELSMKLALPLCKGGLSLEHHVLNPEIALSPAAQDIAGSHSCRGDIYFPAAMLDIEYNSEQYHSSISEHIHDDNRRLALQLDGHKVKFIRYAELQNADAMYKLGHEIAKTYFGKQLRPRSKGYLEARTKLYDMFRKEPLVKYR